MRILHLIPRLVSGGAERQLLYLALELVARGHSVHIGYLAGSAIPSSLLEFGVSLHPLASRSSYDPRLLFATYRLVRQLKPDIIQTWILQMDVFGGLVAMLTNTPWVLREPASAKFWLPSPKTALRLGVARAARSIVSNSVAGDSYWKHHKPDSRRRVIVNAVPLDAIHAAPPADFEVTGGRMMIIFAGRFDAQKNVAVTVDALIKVVQTHPIMAILMGDGPLKADMQDRIDASGCGEAIRLRSYTTELWSIMKSASALISVSHFEGRPNVVLEAMAAGCPLIVSDIPEHREVLDDESCTFVTRYDDPIAVAGAILEVISDPVATQVKCAQARVLVEEFTIERLGREYEALYSSILAGQ